MTERIQIGYGLIDLFMLYPMDTMILIWIHFITFKKPKDFKKLQKIIFSRDPNNGTPKLSPPDDWKFDLDLIWPINHFLTPLITWEKRKILKNTWFFKENHLKNRLRIWTFQDFIAQMKDHWMLFKMNYETLAGFNDNVKKNSWQPQNSLSVDKDWSQN